MGDAMAANDVNMVIYHYHGRLFLYATAPSKEHLDRSHESPVAQRWLEYMATMMVTDDQGKSIMEEMEEAFTFGAFKSG
jgi:L-rhamnose mutarotase